ncbi:aminotransferase class I/II-fold pyridoxal phosphate-dependent enzyme [Pseudooceanicola onchidii]|uniref:aminotransferase class I/II-fold pyridoxal phosphate-dependent enzyme n=1 Tax=Pseudooceanicola onchidii TaxID=2562279 RepID=UPI0010A9FD32|nr:aminotransferase class I/II-fold pyridoxal phosphate-dependent enzyme [Pseudooceanicola onchidii]
MKAIDDSTIGVVLLVDTEGRFLRTVTDGDIRRLLLDGAGVTDSLSRLPETRSITVGPSATPKQMIEAMDAKRIDQLPVLSDDGMPIRIVHRRDLGGQVLLSTPHIGEDELAYVNEAFSTNWIAPLGPNVDQFERDVAEYVGSAAACALSSGTAAIHLGLDLLGVGQGDTVFVSDFTFIASVNPVLYLGAEPVLIDSEPQSWNMSPAALERAFDDARRDGKMPKAVVVVNLYGQSADYDPLCEICAKYGVPILEDAAESLGAKYKGRSSGTIGKLGCFSFNGNKIITTSGGGMLVGDDPEVIARARHLATQARQPVAWYEHTEIGYNYRLSNILAGVGRGQMKVLDDRVARRRHVGDVYKSQLSDIAGATMMPEPDWSFSNRWLSCMTLDQVEQGKSPDEIIARLGEHRIEARHLWKPMHMQPILRHCRFYAHDDGANEPVSAGLFARGLCLPSGSNMDDDTIARVTDTLRNTLSAR